MHEICSVQCADSNYWCDYSKCSRQMANNARQSSVKRSLHSLNTKLTILWNLPCAIEEIKMCVSIKHEIDRLKMYKVLILWPSFKHFNSTRQMASPEWSGLHSATCRQYLTTAMNSRTMRPGH